MNKNPLDYYPLSDEQKRTIEKYQKSLLRKPVDIVGLAKELGVKEVFRVPLGESLSGKLEKEEGGYCIMTNETEPKERRRFTIAHELAHFLLHREKIGYGITEDTSYRNNLKLNSTEELEANRLAADMLMPIAKIDELIAKKTQVSVQETADTFHVSISALKVRLGIPSTHY